MYDVLLWCRDLGWEWFVGWGRASASIDHRDTLERKRLGIKWACGGHSLKTN